MTLSQFALQLVIGLASGMLIYLTASGMSLIISGMGTINFGQGAFYILGAFICYQTAKAGFPYWLALIIALLIPALLGAVLEFLLRPVFGLDMIYSMLITMGASYIVCDGMVMIWGNTVRATSVPTYLSKAINIKTVNIAFPFYYIFIILVAILVAVSFWVLFNKTKLGIYFRAIISDRQMVEHLGINVQSLFAVMFMIGIGLGGLAGALNAPISGLTPKQGMTIFNNVMPALMVGGMDNINGCLPAALVLGVASSMAAVFLPTYYNMIPAVIMVIVMLFKPQGLFSRKES
jgi:branched-subunit amino acid ABC-type transport system permease component